MAYVYCTPCATAPGAWTHAYDLIRGLYESSQPRIHQWVATPEEAEIILLCNPHQKRGDASENHPLRLRYPKKTFVLSEQWTPEPRFAGIYANAPKRLFWRSRFRTASYALHHPDFKNPYVQAFEPAQALPPERRDVLFSFAGRNCHPVRDQLYQTQFTRSDIRVQDTSSFDAFKHSAEGKLANQREYFELCLRSKFILCPRGVGPNSIRLFEALQLGIAPIILADDWIPCEGPAWDRFAIFVPEAEVGRIEEIATAYESEFVERGREARKAHEAFFAPTAYFNYLVGAAQAIQRSRVLPEPVILKIEAALEKIGGGARRARRLVLRETAAASAS